MGPQRAIDAALTRPKTAPSNAQRGTERARNTCADTTGSGIAVIETPWQRLPLNPIPQYSPTSGVTRVRRAERLANGDPGARGEARRNVDVPGARDDGDVPVVRTPVRPRHPPRPRPFAHRLSGASKPACQRNGQSESMCYAARPFSVDVPASTGLRRAKGARSAT